MLCHKNSTGHVSKVERLGTKVEVFDRHMSDKYTADSFECFLNVISTRLSKDCWFSSDFDPHANVVKRLLLSVNVQSYRFFKVDCKVVLESLVWTCNDCHHLQVRSDSHGHQQDTYGNILIQNIMLQEEQILFENHIAFGLSLMCRAGHGCRNDFFASVRFHDDTIFAQLFLHKNNLLGSVDDKVPSRV